MNGIQRILCPIDFTEFSRRALRHAIALARWKECELVVLHVVEPAIAIHAARGGARPSHPDERHRHVVQALGDFAAPASAAGIPVRTVVEQGAEVEEILRQVRALGADLLVMGTHGRGGLERMLLGSVTDAILRNAVCPVMVVPSNHLEPGEDVAAGHAQGPYAHIVCPIDFSECSRAARRAALDLAAASPARLTLLHALEAHEEAGPAGGDSTDGSRDLTDDAVQWMADELHQAAVAGVQADSVVMRGKAASGIVSVAEDLLAELIVMGVRGHASTDRSLFGSTAQHVTRAALCPILTIHET
jgi:nucleotide-binding universal stress UspA family protein